MLYIMALATVINLTAIIRNGYGAVYYAMDGLASEPDLLVSRPGMDHQGHAAEGWSSGWSG